MKDKQKLVEIQIWIENDEDLGAIWVLPHVTDDVMVDFYRAFMDELCSQISRVPGAEKLVGLSMQLEEPTEETEDD